MPNSLSRWLLPFAIVAASALSWLGPGNAHAQIRPDAGRIQHELERGRLPEPPVPSIRSPQLPEPPGKESPGRAGKSFLVKGFRISRNTAFTDEELLAPLKPFVGRDLSFADLENAAELVTRIYRENDYFVARAYVPVQEMQDGIVEMVVYLWRPGQ